MRNMAFDFSKVENGTIVSISGRQWVCIHHSKCDMALRDKFRKNIKDHTGFYLFGGLWYEGDPLTDKPYGKCREQLKRGMLPEIEGIVGHISKDADAFKRGQIV